MKLAPLLVAAALTIATVIPAAAGVSSFDLSCDEPIRLADRQDLGRARKVLTTTNRKMELLMTDRVVAMQFSDRFLGKLRREIRDQHEDDDNLIEQVIKTAVLSTVRTMLSHSAEVDIRDIESADFRDGELILLARNGERLFANTNLDDDQVMRAFREPEARAFVRELRRRMGHE